MFICIYMYIYIYSHIFIYVYTCIFLCLCKCMSQCMHIYMYSYTNAYSHNHIRIYLCLCIGGSKNVKNRKRPCISNRCICCKSRSHQWNFSFVTIATSKSRHVSGWYVNHFSSLHFFLPLFSSCSSFCTIRTPLPSLCVWMFEWTIVLLTSTIFRDTFLRLYSSAENENFIFIFFWSSRIVTRLSAPHMVAQRQTAMHAYVPPVYTVKILIFTHTHMHTHTYAHTRTRTCTHTHARSHAHTHDHTHTHTHTHMHTSSACTASV